MSPLLPPTPFNNLARGGLTGVALVALGGLALMGAKGDPRVMFCGAAALLVGALFLFSLFSATGR